MDTWAWLVLANCKEPAFEKVKAFYHSEKQAGVQIITSDYILDEVITFLFVKSPASKALEYLKQLFASIEAGFIRLERIGPDRFEKTWKMRIKYKDHPKISFTDFSSFIVMQESSTHRVLTHDHHFEEVNLGFQILG